MAKKENQFVQEITPRDVDFAKWYTDIVLKNDMCDYTDVRGKLYKQNLLKAIDRNYGQFPALVKGIKMKIQMMPQKQFQELIGTNRAFQIGFQYTTSEQISRISAMRDFLGLRSENYDDYM